MNKPTNEPERLPLCEICGSPDQVEPTADPDKGGLLMCHKCRVLFGFESEPVKRPLFEEIPY